MAERNATERPVEHASSLDPASANAAAWLDEHGDALWTYAMRCVGRRDVAEDLVQESFVAALRDPSRHRGEACVRTWLIAILKRKVVDHFRALARRPGVAELPERAREETSFTDRGTWAQPPADWSSPRVDPLDRAAFRRALSGCLSELPPAARAAFVLREVVQMSTPEVCEVLAVTAAHLHVLLHRARMRLRGCLESRWSPGGKGAC
ncbi:MAG: hypothetical protein BroJett003_13940 [Planctomycetota bacterium]|nr:MAG: hypothetical protein BroJett003_13940 [Planctomycetota bacterium]